jgi:CheY-like chemotaxis protein
MATILTDYTIDVPDPGMRFLQGVQMARQQRQQQDQAQAMQADMQDYITNPTPQKLANLHLKYPAWKESLKSYQEVLSDADARMTRDFASQAFGLNRAGRPEEVLTLFDQRIDAAKNSNRPDMVQALQSSRRAYELIDDPTQREAILGSIMAGTGQEGLDLYEKVFSSNLDLDTSLIKNVVAMGYKPGSDEFKSQIKRQMDKITITRPDGSFISGTPDEIRSVLGQGGGKVIPRINTFDEAKRLPPGSEFIGPDGKPYRVPRRSGGQTGSAPSGSFPGQ